MLMLLIGIDLVFYGVGVWVGYRIAKAKHAAEIEELKKQPVNVKYIRANFAPVTVERKISLHDLRTLGTPYELETKRLMMQELGEAVWPYANRETEGSSCDPLGAVTYRATLYVRSRQESVHHE